MSKFDFNRFFFAGRLAKDPELRQTQNGTPVVNFDLAVSRQKTSNEEENSADFFRLTAFDKTAQFIATYFRKGSAIFVEGRVQNHNYTDNSGQKRYENRFVVTNAQFVDSKAESDQINARSDTPNQAYNSYAAPQYNTGTPYTPTSYTTATAKPQPTQNVQVNMEPVDDALPF